MTKKKAHAPEFNAKVVLEAIREDMMLAELSKIWWPRDPDKQVEACSDRENSVSV
tara:strand:- start:1615 stop:1779 length:165 start_codon:yes stop_codon:yes gene_type:complete